MKDKNIEYGTLKKNIATKIAMHFETIFIK
jgi:hypothetical protein